MGKIKKLLSRARRLFSHSPHERALARFEFWKSFKHRTARFTQSSAADYLKMQSRFYERAAALTNAKSGALDGDVVVGYWTEHDKWPDYEEFLLKYVPPAPASAVWSALEYGCGPGRNIRRFSSRFQRIDGIDISQTNLDNAQRFLKGEIPEAKWPRLYLTKGSDTGSAPENHYDFCFSTICFQHICVWEVRYSILQSLFRVLKPGGRISIQMGYGVPSPDTAPYHSNHYRAGATNSGCDVAVSSPKEIEDDLSKIGFGKFEHWIRPVGPGDDHPNWIFFTAIKPPPVPLKGVNRDVKVGGFREGDLRRGHSA